MITLFLAPFHPMLAQHNKSWEKYILPNRQEARKTTAQSVLIKYSGKRSNLNDFGINVLRRLDETHYIVAKSSSELAGPFEVVGDANNLWKLSERLMDDFLQGNPVDGELSLMVTDMETFSREIDNTIIDYEVKNKYHDIVHIVVKNKVKLEKLLSFSSIKAMNLTPVSPVEEAPLRDFNYNVNQINRIRHETTSLNGHNLVVSVKEQKYDIADIDFKGRHIESRLSSEEVSIHSTEMATIIAGAGNSSFQGRGIAWGADITSSDFSSTLPDGNEDYETLNVSVQNHSYGTLPENFYGAEARAYDLSANYNPKLLHVFSSGNNGLFTHTEGHFAGVKEFANLTGNFKMAKNIVTVGGVDTVNAIINNISKGPAFDGRVKPELVAYSLTGASSAAAVVSGVSLLLQQEYREKHDIIPHSALIKAVLVNSADDVAAKGIDYISGYGNLNAYKAWQSIVEQRHFEGEVNQNEVLKFEINVPENAINLKVTLVWNDPAAEANTGVTLINDLDLRLIQTSTSDSYLPWVLNHYPHVDSLQLPAVRKVDRLNNIEQVSIADAEQGTYEIEVSGFSLPDSPQKFFITYQWDNPDTFTWTFPTASDNMPQDGEFQSFFRWESTLSHQTGKLEYSTDNGMSWKLIAEDVDLSKKYASWIPPETTSIAKARMSINGNTYETEDFVISRPLNVKVGFDCSDSLMLTWRKIDNVDNYIVRSPGSKYLEHVTKSSDTIIVINKTQFPQLEFSVTPVIGDKAGLRNLTFNYTERGSGCYITNFFSNINPGNGVDLNVSLGTNYQVKELHFQRFEENENGFRNIFAVSRPTSTENFYTDTGARDGKNIYRIKIDFEGGEEIFSKIDTVLFLKTTTAILFPNPVKRFQNLSVLLKDFGGDDAFFKLFDTQGQLLFQKKLARERDEIPFNAFRKGLYLYEIISANDRQAGRIIVQ